MEVTEILQVELRLPAGERAHSGHGVNEVLHARRRHLPGVHGEQTETDAALQPEYLSGGEGPEEVVGDVVLAEGRQLREAFQYEQQPRVGHTCVRQIEH